MSQKYKCASVAPRAMWATPVPPKRLKGTLSKLLFWKKKEDTPGTLDSRQCTSAIRSSGLPILPIQHNPEWRRDPRKYLTACCRPMVIEAIQAIPKQATCSIHFVNSLKNHPSLIPVRNVLNLPPTTADRYVPLLHFFFTNEEVDRIATDMEGLKSRILRLHHRPQDIYTWWDMIRKDLDEVCDRAVKDYFAREEKMWIVPRLVHRCRRVNCPDQYHHRQVKEWRWKDKKWWLEITFLVMGEAKDKKQEVYAK